MQKGSAATHAAPALNVRLAKKQDDASRLLALGGPAVDMAPARVDAMRMPYRLRTAVANTLSV